MSGDEGSGSMGVVTMSAGQFAMLMETIKASRESMESQFGEFKAQVKRSQRGGRDQGSKESTAREALCLQEERK